jgi:hypothetical protein
MKCLQKGNIFDLAQTHGKRYFENEFEDKTTY